MKINWKERKKLKLTYHYINIFQILGHFYNNTIQKYILLQSDEEGNLEQLKMKFHERKINLCRYDHLDEYFLSFYQTIKFDVFFWKKKIREFEKKEEEKKKELTK